MKKLFAILILSVFMLSFASALKFDNVKSYDSIKKEVTIKNLFGLGKEIGKAKLNTPLNFEVPAGYQKVAEFDLWAYQDYNDIIKNLKFYDKNNKDWKNHKFERDFDLKYKTYETVLVKDYEDVLVGYSGNGTKIYEYKEIGSHYEEKEKWIKFTPVSLKKNEMITIGIFTKVKSGDYVEWILELYGVKITEWAAWASSLNTGLRSYYKLDEISGIVIDALGNYNGTNNGSTPNVPGKINKAYDFESGEEDDIQLTDQAFYTTDYYSMSGWFKAESVGALQLYASSAYNQNGLGFLTGEIDCYHTLSGGGGGECKGSVTINADTWYHQVCTYNGTVLKVYFNGINVANCSRTLKTGGTYGDSRDRLGAWVGDSSHLDGVIDEIGYWNRALTTDEVENLYNNGNGIGLNSTGDLSPTITLNSPASANYTTSQSITINLTASDDINLNDVKLYVNDILNQTNSSGINNTDYLFNLNLGEGDYTIYGKAIDNESKESNSGSIRIIIDSSSPQINITSPLDEYNYMYTNYSLILNTTITDLSLDTCWYNYNGTNITFSCSTGVQFNETFLQEADNFNITVYANDTYGNENSETSIWDYKIFENSRTLNSSSYETKSELFQINVSNGANLTAVTLDYNGTEYSTTKSGDVYSKTLDIPIGIQNRSVRWKFTYGGDTIYSDYSYQNISEIIWTLCNASYTDDFLNISFKDESNLSSINASIPTSTFNYYLGSGTVTKSYTYENTTSHLNYTFCGTPNLTFNIDSYIQYKQGTDYPQRIYDPDVLTFSSTVTNKILYLLNIIDGIYVTFQVINSAQQGISNVEVSGTRLIAGETVAVANGLTDAAGAVTFWLNPDFQHEFTFSKTGYETTVYTVTPTQSTYTVSLGGGVPSETDCTRGVSYQINPSNNFLDQNTEYDFSFTIDSSYWALTKFNISLYYGNDTLIDSVSSTTQEGGTLTFTSINTTNQTEMYLKYAYEVNDSICLSTSTNWIVQSIDGRDYSIWYLFTQSSEYLDANLYGVKGESGNNDFGKIVIVFLIVVLIAGISIQKFGIQSEPAIMSIIFAVVAMLDFGLNFIPTIQVGDFIAIPHFVTVVTFIMWLAFLWKER